MFLAVFHEFAHPEVLEEVKKQGICDVEMRPEPIQTTLTPEELQILRTNAKLITISRCVTGLSSPMESLTQEEQMGLKVTVDKKLEALIRLGFKVEIRHPKTSAGYAMPDRVILSFPE
ncbi:unnamed protein product [Phytomonas sp. Hart1]|nr:unnamed protein product [Phytomonas sp. Hart1]|eukprot:CCW66191.1 unnamed protein product [Phytomonas sp. isolate Hart1]